VNANRELTLFKVGFYSAGVIIAALMLYIHIHLGG